MCMQAHDARAGGLRQPLEFVKFEQRDAELGMHARSTYMIVMTPSMSGIYPDEQLLVLE